MTNEEIIKGNRVIAEKTGYFNSTIEFCKKKGIFYNWKEDRAEINSLKYHSDWSYLMPVIERIRDQMGLYTVWQTMKALQENYAKVSPEDFHTITDVWKAVVIYFEIKK